MPIKRRPRARRMLGDGGPFARAQPMNLFLSPLVCTPPAELPVEIVERKGIGHPDTVCDALAEQASVALSRFYLERFGSLMHHNVDKGLLWGGAARAGFGGGEILQPIELYLAGRATEEYRGVRVPLPEIVAESSRQWLRRHLRHLDADRHVRVHSLIRPSSADLADLFLRRQGEGAPLANDTSFGVGFAPLDALEQVVLGVERHLNSAAVKAAHPEIGEDIKVMGVRCGGRLELTVACALVAAYVASFADYTRKKEGIRQLALEAARSLGAGDVGVAVNTADGTTPESLYLTASGTSAEAGDDGQVGRGNRANGLITPYRPMSLEALAGKNPVTHVGKLYNVAAGRLAKSLVRELAGVREAHCCLVSRIGAPIDEPQALDLRLRLDEGASLDALRPRVQALAREGLRAMPELWREFVAGAELAP
jgi:S-adenosylmethionine synthetase